MRRRIDPSGGAVVERRAGGLNALGLPLIRAFAERDGSREPNPGANGAAFARTVPDRRGQ